MIRKSIYDAPTTPRLSVLLEWTRDGNLFVPEFQRPFEWDDERRLNLLDSVSRGLPIGALMVWRTTNEELRTFESIGPFKLPAPASGQPRSLLIDGHQRLTTLYSALQPLAPGEIEELRRASNTENWPIYFDLEAGEDANGFVLAPQRKGFVVPHTWLPTNELFIPKALFRRQRLLEEQGRDRLGERIEDLSTAFKDYFVPVIPLLTDDIRAVTDSFVRVNSGGKPVSEDKMLRALVYADRNIDGHIDEIRTELRDTWGEVDARTIASVLKVHFNLDAYRSTPFEIAAQLRKLGDETALRALMIRISAALQIAAKVLRAAGVPGSHMLPYQFQLVCLTEAVLRLGWESGVPAADLEEVVPTLRRWVLVTSYARYFTGITAGVIRGVIAQLVESRLRANALQLRGLNLMVEPLNVFRQGSVRAMAQLLWGATMDAALPRDGAGTTMQIARIFPDTALTSPGNHVLVTASELHRLRTWLRNPDVDSGLDLEVPRFRGVFRPDFSLEDTARQGKWCELRSIDLEEAEAEFVRSLGLEWEDD